MPVVYVTDGHEYAADHMGSLTAVLDNLIDDGTLRPTIAVFIDPRDPNNLDNNRRLTEYNMNPQFAGFVASELVPAIDAAYRTSAAADDRVILGTSMGGLNSAYFGATKSDVFHKIAIQSPAFSFNPSIYGLYDHAADGPARDLHDGGHDQRRQRRHDDEWYPGRKRLRLHVHPGERRALVGQLARPIGRVAHGARRAAAADTGRFQRRWLGRQPDYSAWRNSVGQGIARGTGADGNNNGTVDESDFQVWKGRYGKTYPQSTAAGGGGMVKVPEPAGGALLVRWVGRGCGGARESGSLSGNSSCRRGLERRQLRGPGRWSLGGWTRSPSVGAIVDCEP